MTSLDALFAEMKTRKLFVSNFYQGSDDLWRCWLRKRRNDIGKMRGMGSTPTEALRNAIDWKPEPTESEPPVVEDQFKDILG